MGWLIAGLIVYFLMVVAEKALIAVTPHELEMLRAEGTPSARRVVNMAEENSRSFLAAVAIGRLFMLVAIAVGFSNWLLFQPFFQSIAEQSKSPELFRFGLALAVILPLSLLLWKMTGINLRRPQNPVAGFWLQRLSVLITICSVVFRPFLPKKPKVPSVVMTDPPDIAQQQQIDTSKGEIEMLKSIARFGDVTVRQVMQPQPKIVALDLQTPFHEVLALIRTSDFSRLPVFEGDLDNVKGTLYVKDIVNAIGAPADFDWTQRIRPDVFIVPESKPVSELLREFKERHLHLALVVDEYGGTAGLVTLEDILEEVTGEIRDEFDEENEIPPYQQLTTTEFLFSGATMINDVCQIAGIDSDTFDEFREDADTIAGLVLAIFGDIPAVGDEVRWNQYLFTIIKADNRRIEEVRLTILED
jgi:CBS domain containing-hemolysin-like protein